MPKGMWAAAAYLAPALVALHGISEMMEASTHGSMHLFDLCALQYIHPIRQPLCAYRNIKYTTYTRENLHISTVAPAFWCKSA